MILVLLQGWRWAMVVTEAAPVCFSQDLFSLFDFLKIMIVLNVGTIFKIRRNFQKRKFFN